MISFMFITHNWNSETSKNEPVTMGVGTTVAILSESRLGYYAWTMDYSIRVEFLVATYWSETEKKFITAVVERGTEEVPCITAEQKALVVIDAPPALMADYAAHLKNVEYAAERWRRCQVCCGVAKNGLAIVYKGRKVEPGQMGRAFWFADDSSRIGLDPRPLGAEGRAPKAIWVDGPNTCAIPSDLLGALRPDEQQSESGTPDWALGFVFALPGTPSTPEVYGLLLSLAEAPEKLEDLRLLGEAIRTRPAPAGDRKSCGAQAALVQGVAERIGFRAPRPKAPAPEKKPRARKVKAEQAAAV